MEGYTYIENGIPVISAERKPLVLESPFYRYHSITLWRNKVLNEFEDNLIPVKNVRFEQFNKEWQIIDKPKWSKTNFYHTITPGQKVQHNEGEINKIL